TAAHPRRSSATICRTQTTVGGAMRYSAPTPYTAAAIPPATVSGGGTTNGRHRALNSGTDQISHSRGDSSRPQYCKATCPKASPSTATQHDSTRQPNVRRFRPSFSRGASVRATARANDAGTEANRKKRGPQKLPPYHAHHLAYTSTSP